MQNYCFCRGTGGANLKSEWKLKEETALNTDFEFFIFLVQKVAEWLPIKKIICKNHHQLCKTKTGNVFMSKSSPDGSAFSENLTNLQ